MLTIGTKTRAVQLGAHVVLCVCLWLVSSVSADTQNCVDVSGDVTYKSEDIEGTWYPMEIVVHRNDSKILGVPTDSQCPVVTFTVSPKSKKTIIMLWNSTEGDLEYKFQQKSRGQWQAMIEQKGSLVNEEYKHYGGYFHIYKLGDDYMFLHYCSKLNKPLSTVAFSKSDTLPQEVLEETLRDLESRKVKLSREIKIPQECDEGDNSHRLLSSCLLSILPSLVVRFLL